MTSPLSATPDRVERDRILAKNSLRTPKRQQSPSRGAAQAVIVPSLLPSLPLVSVLTCALLVPSLSSPYGAGLSTSSPYHSLSLSLRTSLTSLRHSFCRVERTSIHFVAFSAHLSKPALAFIHHVHAGRTFSLFFSCSACHQCLDSQLCATFYSDVRSHRQPRRGS